MSLFLLMPIIFAGSLILTMVGLGGGLVFSPLFVLLGFPVSEAVSASLFLNGIAAISAAITYFRRRMVDVRLGIPLIISSSLAAPLGALATSRVDTRIFTAFLAVVVLLAAARMLIGGKPHGAEKGIGSWHRIIGSSAIGLAIGFMGGMLGIGGGVFIVPLLVYCLRVPMKTAAATSIFVVVFSSFSGFLGHFSQTDINWRFIMAAAVCSFAGGQIGSRIMAEKLRGKVIQRIFGVVLLIFAFKLLQKFWL